MITGGYGRIGSCLSERLMRDGYSIFTPRRGQVNLLKWKEVTGIMLRFRVGYLVHLAAQTNVERCETNREKAKRANVEMTISLVKASKAARIGMLFASTNYVFEGVDPEPLDETHETYPIQVYGRTKLLAEQYVAFKLFQHRIVRLQSIYCFGGKTFVDVIAANAKGHKPTQAIDDQVVCPTSAAVAADAIASLIEDDAPSGVYHASTSDSCTWYEFAKEMSRRSYYDPDLIVPARRYEMGWEAARPKYTVFDCAKIQRLTRWVAPSWKDALAAEINMPEEEDVKRGITV